MAASSKLAPVVRAQADALIDLAYDLQEKIPANLYQLSKDVAELALVTARVLEGQPVLRAFGSPGDWGYGTPVGDALLAELRGGAKAAPQPTPWPQARDVGRIGDMSPSAHMRVGLDSDNDVYVSVWDERGGGSIEFCCPGGGGGQSTRTRMALIALMVAMEADNAEQPSRDWWARRGATDIQAQEGGAA